MNFHENSSMDDSKVAMSRLHWIASVIVQTVTVNRRPAAHLSCTDLSLFAVQLQAKHQDSAPEQLPKRPHRCHFTVSKHSGKISQHRTEGNLIHGIEQDKPRGMKNRGQNKIITAKRKKNLQGNPTRQYRASVHKATPAKEHNCPYQIRKTRRNVNISPVCQSSIPAVH